MNIDYVLSAHGLNFKKGGIFDDILIETVKNFTVTSSIDGVKINLSWNNPTNSEFVKTEIYVSNIDLSNASRDYCISNATKIVNSKATSYSHGAVVGQMYYFKAFCIHVAYGIESVSNGVVVNALAQDTEPPNPITNFTVTKEDNKLISLIWDNPTNPDFNKVKIVYKTGSYPTSHTNGTVGYEGSGTSATITGLTNDLVYYFRAFTFDNNGNINASTSMQITGAPSDVKIYGVRIDKNNSNPETALTYTDNAIGMTGGSTTWDSIYPFNQIRPVVFKNGVVNYELNKNDFTKKSDGTAADITSGNDGDVMIEFPKIWWKFETIGTDLYVKYATKQVDSSWKCLAHTKGSTEKDFVYIGTYLGFETSGKLRSLSGKSPTVSKAIGAFRTSAQENGMGYQQMGYFQLLMLQVLFLIRYKNRDSQTALGRGYVDGNSGATSTGGTNTKGMNFGETTGKQQNKFCGIEDFWGNCYYWIDGFYSDSNRNILIGTQNFNDTGSGYTNYGQGDTSNLSGYISDIQGGTETGFVVKATAGSTTTHYADYGYLFASRLPSFGGSWSATDGAGAFRLVVDASASAAFSVVGARVLAL